MSNLQLIEGLLGVFAHEVAFILVVLFIIAVIIAGSLLTALAVLEFAPKPTRREGVRSGPPSRPSSDGRFDQYL